VNTNPGVRNNEMPGEKGKTSGLAAKRDHATEEVGEAGEYTTKTSLIRETEPFRKGRLIGDLRSVSGVHLIENINLREKQAPSTTTRNRRNVRNASITLGCFGEKSWGSHVRP